MNGARGVPTVTWSNTEWELIAGELKRRHPIRMTHVWSAFNYSLEEFDDAMEAVIRQERHKGFDSFEDARQPLFDAFKRLKFEGRMAEITPTITTKGGITGVFWSDEDYEKVLLELERNIENFFDDGMKSVNAAAVREAEKVLPEYLRRVKWPQVVSFKSRAIKIWGKVLAKRATQKPTATTTPAPIVEPAPHKSHDNKALATAMHEAFHAPLKEKKKYKTRCVWKPSEWLDIAREMHRQNPHASFFTSTFEVIDLTAVRAAQREVIPFERRRSLHQTHGLQGPLVDAFKMLKLEMQESEAAKEQQAAVVAESVEKALVAPPIEFKPHPSTPPVQQVMSGDFTSRLMSAATPLMQMLTAEIAKQLAPEIIKAFAPMIESAIADIKQAAKPVVSQAPYGTYTPAASLPPLSKQEIAAALPAPVEKPRKPKIAVLAFPGVHHHELEQPFPQFEFVWIEQGRGIKEVGAVCELFVACSVCMTPSNTASIKAHVPPEKVKTVPGGVSSLKRQIQIWLSSKNEQTAH